MLKATRIVKLLFYCVLIVIVIRIGYQLDRLIQDSRVSAGQLAAVATKLDLASRSNQLELLLANLTETAANTKRLSAAFSDTETIKAIKVYYVKQNESLLQAIALGKLTTQQLNRTLATSQQTIARLDPFLNQTEVMVGNIGELAKTLNTQVAINGNELVKAIQGAQEATQEATATFNETAKLAQTANVIASQDIVAAIRLIQQDLEKAGEAIENVKIYSEKDLPAVTAAALSNLRNTELITGDIAAFLHRTINPDPAKSFLGKVGRKVLPLIRLSTATGQLLLIITTIAK